jgi:hypothetical protein
VGAIEITGTSNTVGWSRSLVVGSTPRVSTNGLGNRIFRATLPPPAEPVIVIPAEPTPVPPVPAVEPEPAPAMDVVAVRLLDSGVEQTLECQDGIVSLLGSGNRLTLVGSCLQVRVLGAGNQVWVQRATTIDVLGSANTVTWQDGLDDNGTEPTITILGTDSSVTQGPLP